MSVNAVVRRPESREAFEARKQRDLERWRRNSEDDERFRDDREDQRDRDPRRDPRQEAQEDSEEEEDEGGA